jgi:hypothetical protein
MMPEIGDIIEIVRDVPEKALRVGMQGVVVHAHGNDFCEIEFTNSEGETLDFTALPAQAFMVVWRAETQQWLPVSEQQEKQGWASLSLASAMRDMEDEPTLYSLDDLCRIHAKYS